MKEMLKSVLKFLFGIDLGINVKIDNNKVKDIKRSDKDGRKVVGVTKNKNVKVDIEVTTDKED